MMIELEDGTYVSSRLVRKISTVKRKDELPKTRLSLEGDGEYTTSSYALSDADDIASQINDKVVKAEPGYKVVTFTGDASDEEFYFDIGGTIIAWRIDLGKYGARLPITVEQDEDEYAPFVILCPDGKIIDQNKTSFDSIEKWEASARKDWAERRARHLAKKEAAE